MYVGCVPKHDGVAVDSVSGAFSSSVEWSGGDVRALNALFDMELEEEARARERRVKERGRRGEGEGGVKSLCLPSRARTWFGRERVADVSSCLHSLATLDYFTVPFTSSSLPLFLSPPPFPFTVFERCSFRTTSPSPAPSLFLHALPLVSPCPNFQHGKETSH